MVRITSPNIEYRLLFLLSVVSSVLYTSDTWQRTSFTFSPQVVSVPQTSAFSLIYVHSFIAIDWNCDSLAIDVTPSIKSNLPSSRSSWTANLSSSSTSTDRDRERVNSRVDWENNWGMNWKMDRKKGSLGFQLRYPPRRSIPITAEMESKSIKLNAEQNWNKNRWIEDTKIEDNISDDPIRWSN